MEALKSTLLHTLELAVVLAVAFIAMKVFKVDNQVVQDAVVIILGFAVKFVRSSPDVPVKDYVNQ